MNWLTTQLPVFPVIMSALFASTPRSKTCWSDFSPAGIFFMMFSFLVCFIVLAAEWWTDSYKKYYKKLYRCRQTFLKPVHMNKWIHEMTFVCFILLPHMHIMHIGKYQTFYYQWNGTSEHFLFLLCLQIHGKMQSCQMNRKLISQESACYWISKCSVLVSNKEVLFVLSWSGYKKMNHYESYTIFTSVQEMVISAGKRKQPKTKNWSFNEAISNKANWYLCTVELRYISKLTNIHKMSIRYSSIRIFVIWPQFRETHCQGEMSLFWKAVYVSFCLQYVMQPHIVVYILSKVNSSLIAAFTVNISFHL